MGMQIASLSLGGYAEAQVEVQQAQANARQERQRENPLPIEQRMERRAENAEPAAKDEKLPDLAKVTAELEQISMAFDRRLKFVVNHESKEIIIKVIDNETDKVIKELPPEELRRLHNRISETIGFLFDAMA